MEHPMSTTKTYPVSGMSCAGCAAGVEHALSSLDGVASAQVNYANATVLVEYEPAVISADRMKSSVVEAGYDIFIEADETEAEQKRDVQKQEDFVVLKKDTIYSAFFTIPVVIIGMLFMDAPYANWVMLILTTPVVFVYGKRFFVSAIKQLKNKTSNMDTLVAISTGIAFLFSTFNTLYPAYWIARGLEAHVYFEAAAAIITFILLGKFLEEKAKSNTSSAIKNLIGMQPQTVCIIDNNAKENIVSIKEVKKGDVIRVKPGEKIPVDGVVQSGSSYIDESMISGEPLPVAAIEGKSVYAGTINQKGSFEFIAEKVGNETILAQIIKMVREAQGSKAPVQKLVDKIASVFVPAVIGIATITFISWMVFGGENAFTHALLTSVTVLVIACPCALGLATPTAIMVGVGKGAEHNILIKDAESLEHAHQINAIVLDKTGTITEGKPAVSEILWLDASGRDNRYREVLFAMESKSEHPLASAIVEALSDEVNETLHLEAFESITGQGVEANYQGNKFLAGNRALMTENDVEFDQEINAKLENFSQQGKSIIYFATQSSLLAVITITDKVKASSREAITHLQQRGIEVYMLTGDNRTTAALIAKEVGIQHFEAEVMPDDKEKFVRQLQQQGLKVAMVGDGINDSQALAAADISIAMGRGSDIAMDVAKMTLVTSDLNVIPKALILSQQTMNTIRQNLFWAFIYNLIGIPIAAGVLYLFNGFLLNPMIAAAAMAFSSVSVVMNSLRLKWRTLS